MFEALLRCGSVRKAAEDQHVTPGAISQQIRRLEDELSIYLFDRSARAMKPTAPAKALAAELASAFSTIAAAVERARSAHNENVPLRISALPSLAIRIVVPKLSAFRQHAPTIGLSFSYMHGIADFLDEQTDVLLSIVDDNYCGRGKIYPLFSGVVRPVCSNSYLQSRGPFQSPSDLLEAELLHDHDTTAWKSWFAKSGLSLRGEIAGDVYEDFGLMGLAAVAGQGIALCPVHLIERELSQGDLVVVSGTALFESRSYCAVLPEKPRPEAEVFVQWLLNLVANLNESQSSAN